ncbi:hypothetical protein [Carboxylicivirga sp. M1479]|uniref:hypothetical protein n=1 Tax=Carboxylicivirga sp. M1479 TaxID=2594476 RepID=UPI00117851F6|nr:hypothetical protein [Carboxylicivirga sp. M1479]TRX66028.1 hypothetical protein FNN09_15615 [Carboxylicivirga sp. M1479]
MKKEIKHIRDIDQLIKESMPISYEPSNGFVDKVMMQVNEIENNKPQLRYLKLTFQVAAAIALLIFSTNVFILLSSQTSTTNNTEWTTMYESNSKSNWYEYDDSNTFLANNQTSIQDEE